MGGLLRAAIRRGDKVGVIRGYQASRDFWGRLNCSAPPERR